MSERPRSTSKDLNRRWLTAKNDELARPVSEASGITRRLSAFTSGSAPKRIREQAASVIAAMLGEDPRLVRRALYWQRRAVSLAPRSRRVWEILWLGLLHDRAGDWRAADQAFLRLLADRAFHNAPVRASFRIMALAYLWDPLCSGRLSGPKRELWRASYSRMVGASKSLEPVADLAASMQMLWQSIGPGVPFPPSRTSRPASSLGRASS